MIEVVVAVVAEIALEALASGGIELFAGVTAPVSRTVTGLPAEVLRERSFEEIEARVLGRAWAEDERLRSIRELAKHPPERTQRALLILLRDPSPAMRAAAIDALGAGRVRLAYSTIAQMPGAAPAEEAAIVTALARLGGTAAERRILRFLDRGSPEAQLAAARALTHVGTLAAVERLKPRTEAWFAGELGTEAAKAIARIQQRHARAAPGALSLPRGLRGELSIAAPAGALSAPDRSTE